ncbi:MAG: septal ring-binding cell division protein DamX/type II secretory pathway predicted ATPase ExeA [Gammaproteobacteria bacterium]|jgi:septal ring-binding cell division protein DamX/type II secretory pathway predicted ATPase ExeA
MSANSNSTSVRPASAGSIDPFVHSSDSKYYFPNAALRQRIELVRHLVEFGRQIIVLTGGSGSGKSAMLEQVCASDFQNLLLLQFVAGPSLNQRALLKKISDELGISDQESGAISIDMIRKSITAANNRGELVLLIIDDAHNLPADTPAVLAELAHSTDEAAELKIILAADPAVSPLIELLQGETRRQTLVHVVDVPRFNSEQIAELIKHRWTVASGPGEIPLSSAEFAQIYQQSNGVPGKAIVLARQIEILNANAQRKNPDPALRYLVIGGVLITAFLLFAFFNADNPTKTQETQINLELPNVEKVVPKNLIALPMPTAAKSRDLEEEATLAPQPPILAQAESDEASGPTIEPRLLERETEPLSQAATLAPLPPIAVKAELPETSGSTIDPRPLERETEPLSPIGLEPVSDPSPRPAPSTPPAIANPSTLESRPPSDAKITQAYSIEWLRSRPNTGYVLQLFGVRDRSAANAFIKIRNIGKHSDVLVTQLSGQPWYAVVYNYYPDRDSALSAIANLPPNLASTKPWARPIASLH